MEKENYSCTAGLQISSKQYTATQKALFSSQMFNNAITALACFVISSPFFFKGTLSLNETSPKALSCTFKIIYIHSGSVMNCAAFWSK